MVVDDLTMARPYELDGLWRSDTSASRIARRTEPVVLWCAGGSCPETDVRRAVDKLRLWK